MRIVSGRTGQMLANYTDSHAFVLPKQGTPNPAEATPQPATSWPAAHRPGARLPGARQYTPTAESAVFDPNAWFTGGGGSDFQTRVTDTLAYKAPARTAVTHMLNGIDRFLSQIERITMTVSNAGVTAPPAGPARLPETLGPDQRAHSRARQVPTLSGTSPATCTGSEFIGFANYAEAFSDPQAWQALWNTVWFTILSIVPLVTALLVYNGLLG
ncbi:hypothetical protein B0T14DRAFT_493283 [Immersiella caudata]|uniref:Uncharacterized protein n=1 Tax=Immersiella caudata TaxID=314043 RepID=A0AA39X4E4_9PEZI|nr:hypothetical protein B0T14DRAFT_493283 [Immersiella caudata]